MGRAGLVVVCWLFFVFWVFFLPSEVEIRSMKRLYIKYGLYLLKTFPPSPHDPVCLVAALVEPAPAKSNAS